MLMLKRLSALSTMLILSVGSMALHANDGRIILNKERMDIISAGNIAVTAIADGSSIAIARSNVHSGSLTTFGTGVSIGCCDKDSISMVSTSGGTTSIFSSRQGIISVSFGVVFNRADLGRSSRIRRAKY